MKLSTQRIVSRIEPDSVEGVACEANCFRLTILSFRETT